jgi:excisionase family DNA binding protein
MERMTRHIIGLIEDSENPGLADELFEYLAKGRVMVGAKTEYLFCEQIGQELGVGTSRARDLCRTGEIEATRIGKRWQVTRAALDEYRARRPGKTQRQNPPKRPSIGRVAKPIDWDSL